MLERLTSLLQLIGPLIPIIQQLIQQKGGSTTGMSDADTVVNFAQNYLPAYEGQLAFDGPGKNAYLGPVENLDPITITLIISSVGAIATFFANLIKAKNQGKVDPNSTLGQAAQAAEGAGDVIDQARAQTRAAEFFGPFLAVVQDNLAVITLISIGALAIFIFARNS